MKFINKILSDTLKNNNKFSSKKLMSFGAYNTAMLMIWLAFLFPESFKVFYDILFLLFGIAGFQSILTSATNIVNKKLDNDLTNIDNNTSTTIKETTIQKG